jgi:hypothetical protein
MNPDIYCHLRNQPEDLDVQYRSKVSGFENKYTGLITDQASTHLHDFVIDPDQHKGLDKKTIAYFQNYAKANFHDHLEFGFGTEIILEELSKVKICNRWLDLGAGTTTLFWASALTCPIDIVCVDIAPEALVVLHNLANKGYCPPCYEDALRYFGKSKKDLKAVQSAGRTYWAFDFTNEWPYATESQRFDLITAIGSLGLSNDPNRFIAALGEAAKRLTTNGVIIGVNWLRHSTSIAEQGYDTSFLSSGFIADQLEKASLGSPKVKEIEFEHPDSLYSGLVIWSASKINLDAS